MSTGEPHSEIILYQTEDGRTRIQCRLEDETLWLTQAQIAELFEVTPQNVTLHLKAIFAERELTEATQFYNRQRAGLGATFALEVERCAKSILERPEAGPVVRGDVRRRLCRRFPYALLSRIRWRDVFNLHVDCVADFRTHCCTRFGQGSFESSQ